MVLADVKSYAPETQIGAYKELVEQGCMNAAPGVTCRIPITYSWILDYYKMREQTRAAIRAK